MNRYSEQELIPIDKIHTFWTWFTNHASSFKNLMSEHADVETLIFEPLGSALSEIQNDLFFLLGYQNSGEAELILTADGNIKNMFLINAMIEHAPTLDDWTFIGHKKSMDLDNLNININNLTFDQHTIFFRPVIHEGYPDIIDLEIYFTSYQEEELNTIHQGIFIFLDNYIGELNFVQYIDQILLVEDVADKDELVPIGKLKDYLIWREKEFVEEYSLNIPEMDFQYSLMSTINEAQETLIAIINTSILDWEAKASYPWIGVMSITYSDKGTDSFPSEAIQERLEYLEEKLNENLTLNDGAVHIGRQTVAGLREIYFVANTYNRLAQVFYASTQEFQDLSIQTEVYKDKYWRTFEKYQSVAI